LADIHIRETGRETFIPALKCMRAYLEQIPRDGVPTATVIAGDIFNDKTRICPEAIAEFHLLIETLAPYSRVIVMILGNHDVNVNNSERLDLITPILANYKSPKHDVPVIFWPKSGWYEGIPDMPDFAFHVFSPIDKLTEAPSMDLAHGKRSIAILHDFISGASIGRINKSTGIAKDWLRGFTAVMCGHIHDYTSEDNIVFPGALAQVTIGESYDKGFVVWEFKDDASPPTHEFIHLHDVPHAMIKYVVKSSDGGIIISLNRVTHAPIPADIARICIDLATGVSVNHPDVIALKAKLASSVTCPIEMNVCMEDVKQQLTKTVSGGNVTSHMSELHRELICKKVRSIVPNASDELIAAIIDLHMDAIQQVCADDHIPQNGRWTLCYLAWDNLFCYGSGNYINFKDMKGIVKLAAPNRCGKSSIIDILLLALFNKTLRGSSAGIVNHNSATGSLVCIWEFNGERHEIAHKWTSYRETIYQRYTINGVDNTDKDIKITYLRIGRSIGTFEDFVASAVIPQHAGISFINMKEDKKRDTISCVLGFDILERAIKYVAAKEKEERATVRATKARITSAVSRIPRIPKDEPFNDTKRCAIEADLVQIAETSHKISVETRAALAKLESLPAAVEPTQNIAQLQVELARFQKQLPILTLAVVTKKTMRDRAHADLTSRKPLDPCDSAITCAAIEEAQACIDTSMLVRGHDKGAILDDVPRLLSIATEKKRELSALLHNTTEHISANAIVARAIARLSTIPGVSLDSLQDHADSMEIRTNACIYSRDLRIARDAARMRLDRATSIFDHIFDVDIDTFQEQIEKNQARRSNLYELREAKTIVSSFASLQSRAKCSDIDDLPARFDAVARTRSQLINAREIIAAFAKASIAATPFDEQLKRVKCASLNAIDEAFARNAECLRIIDEVARVSQDIETRDSEIRAFLPQLPAHRIATPDPPCIIPDAEIARELAKLRKSFAAIRASCPANCTCGMIPAHTSEYRSRIRALECAMFAPGIVIPEFIPTIAHDANARIVDLASRIMCDSPDENDPITDAKEILYCALRIIRASGIDGDHASLTRAYNDAKFCIEHHEEIAHRCELLARIEYLENARLFNIQCRRDQVAKVRDSFIMSRDAIIAAAPGNVGDIRDRATIAYELTQLAELHKQSAVIRAIFDERDRAHAKVAALSIRDVDKINDELAKCDIISRTLEELREHAPIIRDARARISRLESIMQRDAKNIDESIAQCDARLRELEEVRAVAPEIRDASASLASLVPRADPRSVAEIDDELRELAQNRAIICEVLANADDIANACEILARDVPHVSPDRIPEIKEKIFALDRELADLVILRDTTPAIREALAQYEKVAQLRARFDVARAYSRDVETLCVASRELEEAVVTRDACSTRIDEIARLIPDAELCESRWKEYIERKIRIDDLRDARDLAQDEESRASLELATFRAACDEWREASLVLTQSQERARIYSIYRTALDIKTGVQHELMREAIKVITDEANIILERIAGLRIEIIISEARAEESDTQQIKSTNCTMKIIVNDKARGLKHKANLCSGFQQFIIDIAIRRAFLRAAVRPMPNFLIIDEGFGCLDDINVHKVCECLPELAREFNFMMIISHTEELNTIVDLPIDIHVAPTGDGKSVISSLKHGDSVTIVPVIEMDKKAKGKEPAEPKEATKTKGKGPRKTKAKPAKEVTEPRDESDVPAAAADAVEPPAKPQKKRKGKEPKKIEVKPAEPREESEAPAAAAADAVAPPPKPVTVRKNAIKLDPEIARMCDNGMFHCKLCDKTIATWPSHTKSAKHIALVGAMKK